jgi:pre-mRNA-splicing factor SPF27
MAEKRASDAVPPALSAVKAEGAADVAGDVVPTAAAPVEEATVATVASSFDHGKLLFMENEFYSLVDALPYIDTQLGQPEVAQEVKNLIEEEMRHFEPRDYLESLPEPRLTYLATDSMQEERLRRKDRLPFAGGVDMTRYQVEPLTFPRALDHAAWRQAAQNINMQSEYTRLKLTNLELLSRWGTKAWVARSCLDRSAEAAATKRVAELRSARDEVNKKRKLEQVSCGNELRKLTMELEQYTADNAQTEKAVWALEQDIRRLKQACYDRGVDVPSGDV